MRAKQNSVVRIALSDISKYLNTVDVMDSNHDIWIVCPSHLDTKETRILNRQLGLHKINKGK